MSTLTTALRVFSATVGKPPGDEVIRLHVSLCCRNIQMVSFCLLLLKIIHPVICPLITITNGR